MRRFELPQHDRWRHRGPGEVVLLDNRDSFVFNLAHRLVEVGVERLVVVRSDAITLDTLRAWSPRALVLSPGPGHPDDAGCCVEAVRALSGQLPILGVCLGHQAIGAAFGAEVVANHAPRHGVATDITHDGTGPFTDLPSPLPCGRYHSLIVREPLPDALRVTARGDGWVMGLSHREHPTWGVQFHPESILSPRGRDMLARFASLLTGC